MFLVIQPQTVKMTLRYLVFLEWLTYLRMFSFFGSENLVYNLKEKDNGIVTKDMHF